MSAIERSSATPEWQNLLRSRLMSNQSEREGYRDIVEQCTVLGGLIEETMADLSDIRSSTVKGDS